MWWIYSEHFVDMTCLPYHFFLENHSTVAIYHIKVFSHTEKMLLRIEKVLHQSTGKERGRGKY